MKLTGNSLEQFEKWYGELIHSKEYDNNWYFDIDYFSDSMKYGVLVDFFDSVGIIIHIDSFIDPVIKLERWMFILSDKKRVHLINHVKENTPFIPTRPQARAKAIEKANEIYNKR